MNTIYWRMNTTQGGANSHPGVNLLPGAHLYPGANCAHEHGFIEFEKQQSISKTYTIPNRGLKRKAQSRKLL